MTARPVGDGDGHDELREALAAWLFEKVVRRDRLIKLQWSHLERPQRDGWLEWADELLGLPVVTAWAEQRARERAAEELRAAAEWLSGDDDCGGAPRRTTRGTVLSDHPVVLLGTTWAIESLEDRADALAADDRTGQR